MKIDKEEQNGICMIHKRPLSVLRIAECIWGNGMTFRTQNTLFRNNYIRIKMRISGAEIYEDAKNNESFVKNRGLLWCGSGMLPRYESRSKYQYSLECIKHHFEKLNYIHYVSDYKRLMK